MTLVIKLIFLEKFYLIQTRPTPQAPSKEKSALILKEFVNSIKKKYVLSSVN